MFTPRGDSSFLQNMDFLALSIQIGYVCLKQRSPRVPYARDLWLSERNPERSSIGKSRLSLSLYPAFRRAKQTALPSPNLTVIVTRLISSIVELPKSEVVP